MEKGIVKNWDADRGYGFIVTEEDEDIFVNINDLDPALRKRGLKANDYVTFDMRSDLKGEKAVNVRLAR